MVNTICICGNSRGRQGVFSSAHQAFNYGVRAARNLAAMSFTLGKTPAYVRQLMVGEVGTGKPNRSLACTSAVGNKTKFVVGEKGREMRKRVALGLQHAWAQMINSNHSLEKAVRILSTCKTAFFHSTICILYLIGYN